MSEEQYIYESIEQDGQEERLDRFLVGKLPNLSRSHIQKLIEDNHVMVENKLRKANYRLRMGDKVIVNLPEAKSTEIIAEDIPLDVLYEDSALIVINKARGMVVHPASGVYTGTLVNALLAHCKDLSGINGEIRPGIVHRLDKDTSGVMVAAKTDSAHISLAEQIRLKTAKRQYWAIVHGNIKEEAGVITGDIGRHPTDRKKMAVVTQNGKTATTNFRVLERFGQYTLVECKLLTGRTHQIRVHMAYIGHPLVGDPKYCSLKSVFKIQGQALHSLNLQFIHPETGENMQFSAPVPEDMQKILKALRRQ